MSMGSEFCAASDVETFAKSVIVAMGAPEDVAGEVARHLVRSNLSGHDSHGVMRIPQYVEQMDRRELHPGARPTVLRESASTLLVDAHRGFGHYASAFALERMAAKARENGIAVATIRHATHVGRMGEYTERCARLGIVLIATVGMAGPGVGGMVPHGGRERFFGANVWSIGVPGTREPFVFDASMASIAVGKVYVAKAAGQPVPEACLIDAAGRPSRDPDAYYRGGAVVPLGGLIAGHKGHGLALAAALLGALGTIDDPDPTLAGAPVRSDAPTAGRAAGVLMIGLDPEAFGGAELYRALVQQCLDALRSVPAAPGFDGVRVPGEASEHSRVCRVREGIELPIATCTALAAVGRRFGCSLPEGIASHSSEPNA